MVLVEREEEKESMMTRMKKYFKKGKLEVKDEIDEIYLLNGDKMEGKKHRGGERV